MTWDEVRIVPALLQFKWFTVDQMSASIIPAVLLGKLIVSNKLGFRILKPRYSLQYADRKDTDFVTIIINGILISKGNGQHRNFVPKNSAEQAQNGFCYCAEESAQSEAFRGPRKSPLTHAIQFLVFANFFIT